MNTDLCPVEIPIFCHAKGSVLPRALLSASYTGFEHRSTEEYPHVYFPSRN